MDWGIFWAAAAAIVGVLALVGVVVSLFAYRKQFPRRRVDYTVEATRLLMDNPVSQLLTVSYEGRALVDPYLLRINFQSISRADIPSGLFDAQRPIQVEVTPPMRILGHSVTADDAIGLTWSVQDELGQTALAEIPPQLIRPGAEGEFLALTDGLPYVVVRNSLIDVNVAPAKESKVSLLGLAGAILGSALPGIEMPLAVTTAALASVSKQRK